jgi:hypothetical protein
MRSGFVPAFLDGTRDRLRDLVRVRLGGMGVYMMGNEQGCCDYPCPVWVHSFSGEAVV